MTFYTGILTKDAAGKPAHHRRPAARREEILDAALTIFANKGFSASRVNDIARHAGISGGTLYLYFASKEEIFKSLVQESIGAKVLELAQAVQKFEGSSGDCVRFVMRAISGFLDSSDRAVLPKLIIAETGNFPELARYYRDNVTDRMLAVFETIVRRGIERGEFRQVDPRHTARLVFVPAMFTAIWRASFGTLDREPYDYEGFMQTHLDLILHGLAVAKTP